MYVQLYAEYRVAKFRDFFDQVNFHRALTSILAT